jgi:hypothetical protein
MRQRWYTSRLSKSRHSIPYGLGSNVLQMNLKKHAQLTEEEGVSETMN